MDDYRRGKVLWTRKRELFTTTEEGLVCGNIQLGVILEIRERRLVKAEQQTVQVGFIFEVSNW